MAIARAIDETPWRAEGDGVVIRFRLTPRGGRDVVDGLTGTGDGMAIKARVRAVPEDGKANAALQALVAAWLGIPARDVGLVAGHKSRVKAVAVRGDRATLTALLADRVASLPSR